ncbi:MAG: hypothetical protein V7776_23090 [Halopseudomonas aestusnigri]
MTSNKQTNYSLPISMVKAGNLISFDFSFTNLIIEELPDNFRFISLVQSVADEVRRLVDVGELEMDAEGVAEAVKFLQQEAQATLIAFNCKNSIIQL